MLLVACAPTIEGPIDHQRALDRDDADRLAAQLSALPGAVRADVTLHRPYTDPFTRAVTPGSAAILIVVDDHADSGAIRDAARRLATATAPAIGAPEIAIEVGAIRPELAALGPFTVEARTRPRLVAAIATALAVIALLAAWVAYREYQRARGNSAQ